MAKGRSKWEVWRTTTAVASATTSAGAAHGCYSYRASAFPVAGGSPKRTIWGRSFACLTFDNRGLGRSVPAGSPVTVDRMTADAQAVLDAAGWESAHVVGHSLGGLVAVQLALAARSRVRSLALLCTFRNGRAAAPLTLRMAWLGLRSRVGTRGMRRRGFLRLVLPPGAATEPETANRISELFGRDVADQPPIVGEQLRAMRVADPSSRLDELSGLPTLVVSATHDPIAPPAAGRALASGIPGARYVEVRGASHGLPITHADVVNRLLREHLSAVEATPGTSRESSASPL